LGVLQADLELARMVPRVERLVLDVSPASTFTESQVRKDSLKEVYKTSVGVYFEGMLGKRGGYWFKVNTLLDSVVLCDLKRGCADLSRVQQS
jgi:hypothetical protein